MTPELESALLDRLESALAVDAYPSEREISELRALVMQPSGTVYALPRLGAAGSRRRPLLRAMAAAAAVIALAVVVTRIGTGAPDSSPKAVAPVDPRVDPVPSPVATEMSAVRDALARRDVPALLAAREELVRALRALPPSVRAQVHADADPLLAEVQAFLDATTPHVSEPPTPDEPTPTNVSDDPPDRVSANDDVAANDDVPTPTSAPRGEDEPASGDD